MNLFDINNEVQNRSFECSYTWSDMLNTLIDHNIPREVVQTLPDVGCSIVFKRPILNIFKFDDWLHDQYGDYESEGKSMKDMFKKLFGDDSDKIAYYFGN